MIVVATLCIVVSIVQKTMQDRTSVGIVRHTVTDTIVIGAGLFGSVIAAKLRYDGHDVVVIDSYEPNAGSKPAACLMKPSWFSGLGKEVHEPSLQLLDQLYGVMDLQFRVGLVKTTVHWCKPSDILQVPEVDAKVMGVVPAAKGYDVTVRYLGTNRVGTFHAERVVVAAGIWSAELVPLNTKMTGQMGMALLFTEQYIEEPFIHAWAPYRQLVAFNRGDGLWVGDGTAIKQENWDEAREREVMLRCQKALCNVGHPSEGMRSLRGIRPYVKDAKPCLLEELSPGLWVATGGAKNGTIAAGWCAHEIARRSQ